ncbi:S41 family peptidase [Parapedobacter lycopersici]|uniref:S41 family peptidase n=1 Tax=Parapedobacter lycopersici TaxID=1864939 RepID=UPI00214D97E5|nr:S41 family peptidase [Parapedobacter lycopersici]
MRYRKNMRKAHRIALLAAAIFLCAAFAAVRDELFLISKNLDIFSAVYRQVSMNYVDETNSGKLVKTAVDAMLDDLDPYTEYVQDTDVEDYKLKYVDTRYGGIGAAIFAQDNRIFISEIYAGQPADHAGLQAGDELVAVNGSPLARLTPDEASRLLRGADGSAINLEVRHVLLDRLDTVTLTRAMIRQPNVSHISLLEGGVGYIKLDKFLEQSASEIENAVNNLQRQGSLNGLIIDLRDNGGGILQEAVKIVNLFVPPGELVVSQRGRNSVKNRSYRTMATPIAPDIPLAVLINGHSASAAEIVAGALQDLDRAVIIGERSFGKGLVQQTFNIPYNNLVKVTVAKYYTPAGRCIQALDFHKGRNGKYAHVPDSSIHAFQTKGGRIVYDGSGIYPDITVEKRANSAIVSTLLAQRLIFDYATLFKSAHPHIAAADKFMVSDTQYADFIRFLADRNYHYLSDAEKQLRELRVQAGAAGKPEAVLQRFDALAQALRGDSAPVIDRYRNEIKEALGAEMVSRYYYQEGKKAFSMQHDDQLKRAVGLLDLGKAAYYSILSGEGDYKTIGKPETVLAVTPQ